MLAAASCHDASFSPPGVFAAADADSSFSTLLMPRCFSAFLHFIPPRLFSFLHLFQMMLTDISRFPAIFA
jgi:hypothetical protein